MRSGRPRAARGSTARDRGVRLDTVRRVLPNGLRAVVHENRAAPIACVLVHSETGQRFEPEEKAGISCLAGMLLDSGTKKKSAQKIAGDLEYIGGALSTNSHGVRIKVRSRDLARALEVATDCTVRPVFPADRVDLEREKLLAEIQAEKDSPKKVAWHAFDHMVYGGRHPYHRPVKGYAETVSRLGRKDVISHHRTYFVPNNSVVIVSGDVRAGDVFAGLEDALGAWRPREVRPPRIPAVRRQASVRRTWVAMQRSQIHLYLGHLGIRRTDPDYHALRVMDDVLGMGTGFTDRISRKLRDEQGLAYTVYATITQYAGQEPGTFHAYIGTSPENREKAVAGFLDEIRRIREERVSREELAAAQNYLANHYVFGFESNSQRCDHLLFLERYGLDTDYFLEYPERIRSVTRDEIRDAAARNLDPDHYCLAIAGPRHGA